jgi:glycosyltransferase involved in cell wall biosynthesis
VIIWVFNQFASTPYHSTGAGERHFYIAKHLENDVYTYIFSSSYNHLFSNPPTFKGLNCRENYFDFQFIWLKSPKYNPKSTIQRALSWAIFIIQLFIIPKRNLKKPDIIVVSSMSMFPMINALYYKWKYKCKIVFEIRDIWPLTVQKLGNIHEKNFFLLLMKAFEKFSYRKADHIVSLLPKADIHIKSILGEKNFSFSWIPNAIEIPINNNLKKPLRPKPFGKIPEHSLIVTYAGSLGTANAMEYFFEMIVELKDSTDFFFVVLGDGILKDSFQKKVENCPNCLFIDKVPKNEVRDYLIFSDILYLSWHDSPIYQFGVSANKYNDYMLARKPILASSNLHNDVVEIASCGKVVAAESSKELIKGLNWFLSLSQDERQKMGENGYQFLLQNKTYQVIANDYLRVYKSL